jgi:Na+/proline symporter
VNTFSGFFADQFGFSAGLALTIVYVVSLGSLLAIQFIVGSDLISTTTGLPSVIAMLVMAGVIMSYILPAGLVAVLSTDVLRAIMMTFVLIVIVTVTAIYVPAYSALKEGFTPLPAADGIALLVLGFFGAVCAADVWQTILAAEGYRVVRNSLIIGAIAFMIIGVMIAGLGILTKSTIPELPVDTPAFVVAATRVIPGFLSPFLALMVTGSVMATADTEIWVISTVLVSNIFPWVGQGRHIRCV